MHWITWKTLISLSSPRLFISNPLSSASVPSSLKTAYRFFNRTPSSFEAGKIIAWNFHKSSCKVWYHSFYHFVHWIRNAQLLFQKRKFAQLIPCKVHLLQTRLNTPSLWNNSESKDPPKSAHKKTVSLRICISMFCWYRICQYYQVVVNYSITK